MLSIAYESCGRPSRRALFGLAATILSAIALATPPALARGDAPAACSETRRLDGIDLEVEIAVDTQGLLLARSRLEVRVPATVPSGPPLRRIALRLFLDEIFLPDGTRSGTMGVSFARPQDRADFVALLADKRVSVTLALGSDEAPALRNPDGVWSMRTHARRDGETDVSVRITKERSVRQQNISLATALATAEDLLVELAASRAAGSCTPRRTAT